MRPVTVEVDFNSRDDSGHLPAPVEDASGPVSAGDLVDAFDEEGNRCLALVVAVAGGWLSLQPEWQTFTSPRESRVLVEGMSRAWQARWSGRLSVSVSAPEVFRVTQTTDTSDQAVAV